jgi:hypothetical protein
MIEMCSSLPRRLARRSAVLALATTVLSASPASAQSSLGSAQNFGVLAGTAVTCTGATITGNVGVWPGSAVTQTEGCTITGAIHASDGVAKQAYLDFINAYNTTFTNPPACDDTLTGTLAGETLLPGVYCVDGVAKTGLLTLDAQGNANATWTFLVDGALTGTGFSVSMINGGEPCNVEWWVKDEATMTASTFVGTILAGAAITVTGGTFTGDVLATAAVTLTRTTVSACPAVGRPGGNDPGGNVRGKCNQGVGNGSEGCDPGNSNNRNPSNDERGGTPGKPGRQGQARTDRR